MALLVSTSCASSAARPAEPALSTARPVTPVVLPPRTWPERQQVTHLLNRAAFGPSASDRAAVAEKGLEGWLTEQLTPGVDPQVEHRLSGFDTLPLSVAEAMTKYPRPQERLKAMGVDPKTPEAKERIKELRREDPEQLPRQLLIEATQAKLIRAINSKRQLEEVLVDFWFNHFNVSAEKGKTEWMVTPYERDAIRPRVFGRFRDLLGATAKHPAMLWYLDNWLSVRDGTVPKRLGGKQPMGLNENYARELLELHTLGVDAGYTQHDVREAARALTGWSLDVKPNQTGFGTFVFRPRAHDDDPKEVFGLSLPANGGQADGERLLDFLARHPATAKHVARKLCQRFVADAPPDALVERVAAEYLRTDGDLSALYRLIFTSPEFWADAAYAAKTKTPLEFIASSVRVAGTLDEVPLPLARALEQLGQPLYRCQPPTGYAEVSGPWVSAGALVTRINFGLKLAKGQFTGVLVHWPTPAASVDATIDSVGEAILGQAPTERTRATVKRALGLSEDPSLADHERRIDVSLVAGLLLGAPEFQKQ